MNKKSTHFYIILTLVFIILFSTITFASENNFVYRVDLEGTIDSGMVNLLNRAINEAEKNNADQLIITINSEGGYINSGLKMKDAIFGARIEITTFVVNRALSAAALVALSGDQMVMMEASTIGAAETIPREEKYISAMRSEFQSAAERRGKDGRLAQAMVDRDVEIAGVIESGKLLSMVASEAYEHQLADGIVSGFQDLLLFLDLENARIENIEMTFPERMARIITNPVISVLLLTIAILALVFEIIAPGWGVGGTVGLLGLALFFSGHIIFGNAGLGIVVLLIVGLILLSIEIFVIPGFGITGIGGLFAIFASLFLVFPSPEIALPVLAAVLTFSILGVIILMKIFGSSNIWRRISLETSETVEEGYTASSNRSELKGEKGYTVTPLRPSGIIDIDGERLNVVTEGDFIDKNTKVKIVKVAGNRIIVKKIIKESEK